MYRQIWHLNPLKPMYYIDISIIVKLYIPKYRYIGMKLTISGLKLSQMLF